MSDLHASATPWAWITRVNGHLGPLWLAHARGQNDRPVYTEQTVHDQVLIVIVPASPQTIRLIVAVAVALVRHGGLTAFALTLPLPVYLLRVFPPCPPPFRHVYGHHGWGIRKHGIHRSPAFLSRVISWNRPLRIDSPSQGIRGVDGGRYGIRCHNTWPAGRG